VDRSTPAAFMFLTLVAPNYGTVAVIPNKSTTAWLRCRLAVYRKAIAPTERIIAYDRHAVGDNYARKAIANLHFPSPFYKKYRDYCCHIALSLFNDNIIPQRKPFVISLPKQFYAIIKKKLEKSKKV
jgi:hypothetical protein